MFLSIKFRFVIIARASNGRLWLELFDTAVATSKMQSHEQIEKREDVKQYICFDVKEVSCLVHF